MEAKHTPGPWAIVAINGGHQVVSEGRGAMTLRHDGGAEALANARLIKEAPTMLEALRIVAQALGNGATIDDQTNSVYGDMLRAILARIDGPTIEGEE